MGRAMTQWLLRLGLVAGIGAGLLFSTTCSRPPRRAPRAPTPGKATLTVLSYNVNYALSGDEATLLAIERQSANLVLLQETTPEWERAIRARLEVRYAHMAFRHCCLAGGLGVLSEHEFEELDYIAPPVDGWFPAWRLRVRGPLGPLQVLNVHLHPQVVQGSSQVGRVAGGMLSTPEIRRREMELYLGHLERGVPTLIAGDFNESERGGALERLGALGLHSALPDFSRDRTWRWRTSVGQISRRFDHIVHSRELEVLSAHVVSEGRSDHLPVVAVFELK